MYEEDFRKRLMELRLQKGVSARDMSLSLGQNAGYINSIENGKSLPSMNVFFYICEFFDVTPKEFFDYAHQDPRVVSDFLLNCKKLSDSSLRILSDLVRELTR